MPGCAADLSLACPVLQRSLHLGPANDKDADDLKHNLSALAGRDGWLWLGGDEGRCLYRLERLAEHRYGQPEALKLKEFGLAEGKEHGESDIEGLALDGDRLWLVGSHSLRRRKVTSTSGAPLTIPEESRRNAHLLGCLHLDGQGRPRLGQRLSAGTDGSRDALRDALAADPRITPFLVIPSKDNGLDIEGIAARGNRVLVGLRGPVLRGVALVADLQVGGIADGNNMEDGPGNGIAVPLSLEGFRLRLLDLDGLAVRDLAVLPGSDDVLILAGPTMTLAGPCFIYRWSQALAPTEPPAVETLQPLLCLRDGRPGRPGLGSDKPEGLELERSGDQWLAWVAYDDPTEARHAGAEVETLLDGFVLP